MAWRAEKVITIPAEPADPDLLPPALKPFAAVPPLITDIDLSVDDRFLYVFAAGEPVASTRTSVDQQPASVCPCRSSRCR